MHPPVTFAMDSFVPGVLKAVGYVDGKPTAEHWVKTPGEAKLLQLHADFSSRPLRADGADVIFVYADVTDETDAVESQDNVFHQVRFSVDSGFVIGPNPAPVEAGIAGVLLRAGEGRGRFIFSRKLRVSRGRRRQ